MVVLAVDRPAHICKRLAATRHSLKQPGEGLASDSFFYKYTSELSPRVISIASTSAPRVDAHLLSEGWRVVAGSMLRLALECSARASSGGRPRIPSPPRDNEAETPPPKPRAEAIASLRGTFSSSSGAAATEGSQEQRKNARKPRPTDEVRYSYLTSSDVIMKVMTDGHKCTMASTDPITGAVTNCCDGLYGNDCKSALTTFTENRKKFLSMSSKERSLNVFAQLRLRATLVGANAAYAKQVQYVVQPRPDSPPREVCRLGFLENLPISQSTLRRLELKKKLGVAYYKEWKCQSVPMKELHVIAWWLDYAEQTAERLPDQPFLITPCRTKSDIFAEFRADMFAAGHTEKEIPQLSHFCKVFKEAEELQHIDISALKRNFSRCSVCVDLEDRLQKGLRGHDNAVVDHTKMLRINHLALARADRLFYYAARVRARSEASDVITLIIDKSASIDLSVD